MTDHLRLVADHGSPLYVYDLALVRAAHADLRAGLPAAADLYYSLKANPHPALARQLRRLGCLAEVSSPGELAAALAAGFAGEHCMYTGPGKSLSEVAGALREGVRRFSVESPRDMQRVSSCAAAAGERVEVLLRLNPDAGAGGVGLAMTGEASPFGCDVSGVVADPAVFRPGAGAELVGFHVYTGTNAEGHEALLASFAIALDAVAAAADALGVRPRTVDLGGGFPHPYARCGERPDLAPLRQRLEGLLDARLPGWRRRDPAVAFESGRYLVASSGTLLATVEDVKDSRGRRYVVLDSGVNHLGGMPALGRIMRTEPEVLPVGAFVAPAPGYPARVVGPLCTPLDLWSARSPVADLARGDVVAVPNVGAYGLTASLVAFLSRGLPAEVVVDGDDVVDVSRLTLVRVGSVR